ncbi:methionine import ATP-binding protein MetN [Kaistia sp. 32K]|uniref:methionine ABC transporter ATP-binding protein n=1 Tax=Kaistia sp. 32K TaxID=2795690 RepID=UPI00191526AE|nr:ATP-binding cassette domain-containing protein [Kaistia sp. 32K]BCP52382.1 methionine import ATP-binding protein MetN [Kaistia sp. 32K]
MIRLVNIARDFSTRVGITRALHGINLEVPAGQIFGIIGASGAGKSTLVRTINLLERPTEGDVFLGDERITSARGEELRRLRRRIGMVFQHFNLLNSRTVAGNIAYPLELGGRLRRREIDAKVSGLLARVGLVEHADKYPKQLSGGQRQRVGIARALANDPEVLLCDEATSALDPVTTRSVLSLLREINRDLGVTIVLITHEMEVIRQTCDRVAVLDHGRVVETGPPLDVFLHPKHPATLKLVREAEHLDPVVDLDPADAGRLYRLTLTGETAHKPALSLTARETGVDFEIVEGRVGHVRDVRYAKFVVRLFGGDEDSAVRLLRHTGVHVERVTPEEIADAV